MMVSELTPVPDSALPVARLKDHLRLGSGFAEDQIQDALLIGFLRAALAAIEGQTGKALLRRAFEWRIEAWRDGTRALFPLAPVVALNAIAIEDEAGTAVAAEAALVPDGQAPILRGTPLPAIPVGGCAKIRFEAGYAADFEALPPDLAQATLMLAAHYYDYRGAAGLDGGCMPFGVSALIDRYRPLRLGLGGGA